MVLHELDDDPDVVTVVLDRDDSHNVGRIFGVGILEKKEVLKMRSISKLLTQQL